MNVAKFVATSPRVRALLATLAPSDCLMRR
jgi:hypothetical protein